MHRESPATRAAPAGAQPSQRAVPVRLEWQPDRESYQLAMLLPIMTTPITSSTTTMIVTLLSTNQCRSCSNGPLIRAGCH